MRSLPDGFRFQRVRPHGPFPAPSEERLRNLRPDTMSLSRRAAGQLLMYRRLGRDEEETWQIIAPLLAEDLLDSPYETDAWGWWLLGRHARWKISIDGCCLRDVRGFTLLNSPQPAPALPIHDRRKPTLSGNHKKQFPLSQMLVRFQGRCWLCHGQVALEEATRDHVIPVTLGGAWCWQNLRLAHEFCNHLRGDVFPIADLRDLTMKRQAALWENSGGCCQMCGATRNLFFHIPPVLRGHAIIICRQCSLQKISTNRVKAMSQRTLGARR